MIKDLAYVFVGKKTERKPVFETDFEKLKVIGRGQYSSVFLVRHKKTKKLFAMKKMKKEFIVKKNKIDNIMEERRILSAIEHPNIVHLNFSFQSGGDLFFHLHKLSDYKSKEVSGFFEDRAKFYAAEIFLALKFLHDNGCIYRDMKLENILLDKNGHIKLCDLGLAKQIKKTKKKKKKKENNNTLKTDSVVGTEKSNLAPEMIGDFQEVDDHKYKANELYTSDVDWWSYGIVLAEFIYGENPFVQMYFDHIDELQNKEEEEGEEGKEEEEEEEERIDYKYFFEMITSKDVELPSPKITIWNEKEEKEEIFGLREISEECIDLIKKLLERDPKKRISELEIMQHPFFVKENSSFWKDLKEGRIISPFIPEKLVNEDDTDSFKYIDEEFNSNRKKNYDLMMMMSTEDMSRIGSKFQKKFKGFSFEDSNVDYLFLMSSKKRKKRRNRRNHSTLKQRMDKRRRNMKKKKRNADEDDVGEEKKEIRKKTIKDLSRKEKNEILRRKFKDIITN